MYKSIKIMNILLEQDFENKKHFTDELNRLCNMCEHWLNGFCMNSPGSTLCPFDELEQAKCDKFEEET